MTRQPPRGDAPALFTSIASLRAWLAERRHTGSVGFVPTMGALHEGHASLIRMARERDATVVVSIFVNPLQFDRKDDLDRYPRTLVADLALCGGHDADAVFAPAPAEMYPEPPLTSISPGPLGDHLCGASRPGHFAGVATVVMKLFQIVQPDRAYFGEKDAQQLAIIRRLVADFNVPVEVVGAPTVREADGLAMSSRNRRLTAKGRQSGLALVKAIWTTVHALSTGSGVAAAREAGAATVPADGSVRLEYLEVVDTVTMQPVGHVERPALVAGALWVDGVRLIDNMPVNPPGR
ncbi:MAG: pantoate--beta-alanine ligase [Vicinamibacterales bacterium]